VGKWQQNGRQFAERLRQALRLVLRWQVRSRISYCRTPVKLQVDEIQQALFTGLGKQRRRVLLLVDRLDEGYEADPLGIGLLVGLVQASVDINHPFHECQNSPFFKR